jgi:plastocyanin
LRCLALLAALVLLVPSTASAQTNMVSIAIVDDPRPQEQWGYAPGMRRVPLGTWITWSNTGIDAHTVTAADGSFDSGALNPSEGFSWYFDQDATYDYVCTLHTWMTGRIVAGTGGVAPSEPVPEPEQELPPEPEPEPVSGG